MDNQSFSCEINFYTDNNLNTPWLGHKYSKRCPTE